MLIKLIRNRPSGKALFGVLYLEGKFLCDTLENTDYAIPAGFYRVRLTQSPRFKEILPILDGVWGVRCSKVNETSAAVSPDFKHSTLDIQHSAKRSGIRIHAGNTIEHTEGCILVGSADLPNKRLLSSRKALNQLRECLLNYQKQNPNEEIYIEISEPDAYPMYDIPCPSSECA